MDFSLDFLIDEPAYRGPAGAFFDQPNSYSNDVSFQTTVHQQPYNPMLLQGRVGNGHLIDKTTNANSSLSNADNNIIISASGANNADMEYSRP